MRSSKFWHPMMWFIIESALVNSWVLYKTYRDKAGLDLEYDHFTFRRSIALALASEWEDMGCVQPQGDVSPPAAVLKAIPKNKRAKISAIRCPEDRFNSPHTSFEERIPILEGSNLVKRQMLCRQCKHGRTIFWCRKCTVSLHRGGCFMMFHMNTDAL